MRIISILIILAFLFALSAQAQVSPNSRLIQRPERDGAVFTVPWTRFQLGYQNWNRAYALILGPTIAAPLFSQQLEIGARGDFIYFNPERATDRGRFSDADVWGKYLILDNPLLLSAGGLVTLPTGSEKVELPEASGEINIEGFSAIRFYVSRDFAFTGHTGIRYNSDAGKGENKAEGKFSLGFGGGVIIQATPELNILVELNVETERYKKAGNAIALTGGIECLLGGGLGFNGGLSLGLEDGSPDFELSAGLNYLF